MNALPKKYHNQVLNCDVMQTLRGLPDACLDVVYADPDYNVGIDYAGQKYTRTWDEYIEWYAGLIYECMRVLKDTGNLFTINYPKQNAYLRVCCLDRVAYDVQEYVWVYNTNVGHSKRRLTTAHRSILHATKSKDNAFYKDHIAQPYQNPTDPRIRGRMENGSKGRMPYSWLYYNLVKNVSKDKTIHSCQIPLGLVELLFNASTQENDSIFVLFGGSGSELVLAQKMKRVFLSCEMHPRYYQMIQDRLQRGGAIDDKYRLPCNGSRSNTKRREELVTEAMF